MTNVKHEIKKTNADKTVNFILSNKKLLWSLLALLIITIAVVFIIGERREKFRSNNSEMINMVEADFQEWLSAEDEKKTEKEEVFLASINNIVDLEKNNIFAGKAYYVRGQFYLEKEEWENAASDFYKVVEILPESYLAPGSLYNSASAKEKAGDIEAALALLTDLVSNYKDDSPLIPESLFNIGRLNETLDNKIEALEIYEDLASSYKFSNWTNFAKDRIISLKASGVSQ